MERDHIIPIFPLTDEYTSDVTSHSTETYLDNSVSRKFTREGLYSTGQGEALNLEILVASMAKMKKSLCGL